jgi:phage terminase large subunit
LKISLPNNWHPREYQVPLWNYLAQGGKRASCCWHRRSGKDEVMLHHNACAAFERKGNYWYMLPLYNQCRKAIWNAINPNSGKKRIDEAFPLEIRNKTLDNEMFIEFKNGSTWQLMGSDNYDALVGSPPVGLTFSEYALSNPSAWGFLRPIMLENGGWAIFNSTPRGNNHFRNMMDFAHGAEDWFAQTLTVDHTGLFSQAQLLNELKELQSEHGDTYGKAIWLQEYYCSFDAALPGAIWGEALAKVSVENRICNVPYDPEFPVFTAWDLGRDDDTAIWFYQVIAGEIRVIDYYANNFKEIPFYAEILRQKGYQYGLHWVPHDAKPKKLGMGGKSILQQFLEEDVGNFAVVPNLSVEDGIQAANATFPRCYFDRENCSEGVEHLKSYCRKYDEAKKTFSSTPVHDQHSHASDAFRYLSLTWRQSKAQVPELTQMEKFHKGNVVGINFGAMKKEHFRKKRLENERY